MDYAIVNVPAAAIRRKARHQAEMVSQLLFGEAVRITRTKGNLWVKVRSVHDEYEGWMTNTLLEEVSAVEAKAIVETVAAPLVSELTIGERLLHIPAGSSLRNFAEGRGRLDRREYLYAGQTVRRNEVQPNADIINELTRPWLNAPYLWGGRTVLGVDCSGFVQVIFKMMGIDLPRDAWQQAQYGGTVKKLKEAVCGDLAFFDDKEEIVHVGILLGPDRIIHASGRVRIDSIDKKGIINSDTGKRTHSLGSIKRYW
jgi:cell wall-associated NlpC family hydrolase